VVMTSAFSNLEPQNKRWKRDFFLEMPLGEYPNFVNGCHSERNAMQRRISDCGNKSRFFTALPLRSE
jgi:hypothetical protein